jgi:hypothetical protein
MKTVPFFLVLLAFGPAALAQTVSQCFLKSAGGFEGQERLIVTVSDGISIDVQNADHIKPTVMIRGSYTQEAGTDQELNLSTWSDLIEPGYVTGMKIQYSGDENHRVLSGVAIEVGSQSYTYGDCKILSDTAADGKSNLERYNGALILVDWPISPTLFFRIDVSRPECAIGRFDVTYNRKYLGGSFEYGKDYVLQTVPFTASFWTTANGYRSEIPAGCKFTTSFKDYKGVTVSTQSYSTEDSSLSSGVAIGQQGSYGR